MANRIPFLAVPFYRLGSWLALILSDLSVRKKKTAPFSTFMFLPVSERVELPLANETGMTDLTTSDVKP